VGGADSDSSYPNQVLYSANDIIPNQKKTRMRIKETKNKEKVRKIKETPTT
jgi:hypothetical protein